MRLRNDLIPLLPKHDNDYTGAISPWFWYGTRLLDGTCLTWAAAPLGSKFWCVEAGQVAEYLKITNTKTDDDWQRLGSGGSSAPLEITYADLVTAIGAANLSPGAFYCITDFATTHYIVDADATQYVDAGGIVVGETEPLLVQALSASTLSTWAQSTLYPQDMIRYDWDADNWTYDLAFWDETAHTVIPGYKGTIMFRHDTLRDNYAGYDWRHCLTRRWKTDADAWAIGSTYSAGAIVSNGNYVYRALIDVPPGTAISNATYWMILLYLSPFAYWNAAPSTYNGVTSSDEYDDFPVFRAGVGLLVTRWAII